MDIAFSPDSEKIVAGGIGHIGNIDHLDGPSRVEYFSWQKAEKLHEFTVQVAAFSSHESAEKLRARLKELGYDARITSDEPPYRVRVGRYATREQADSLAARMKTQHVDGYVTSAEPRR